MTKLSYLFTEEVSGTSEWTYTKNILKSNIDSLLKVSKCNEDVLLLMKELLEDVKINTSILDYIEEVSDGNK